MSTQHGNTDQTKLLETSWTIECLNSNLMIRTNLLKTTQNQRLMMCTTLFTIAEKPSQRMAGRDRKELQNLRSASKMVLSTHMPLSSKAKRLHLSGARLA